MVAPATGTTGAVNPKVTDPSLINTDPYNEGWIFSMRLKDAVNGPYHENVA